MELLQVLFQHLQIENPTKQNNKRISDHLKIDANSLNPTNDLSKKKKNWVMLQKDVPEL